MFDINWSLVGTIVVAYVVALGIRNGVLGLLKGVRRFLERGIRLGQEISE